MEKHLNHHRGIIIQNDDPEQLLRVKVWCPHLSSSLFEGWSKDREKDKKFTNLGSNLNSSLTPELLQRLRESLPWAQVKMPIFGMGTSVTYNADRNFSEKANDSEASKQHTDINKTLPETPNDGNLADAIKASQAPSTAPIEDTPSVPDYVKNSVSSSPTTPTTVKSSPATKTDNIGGVSITYNDPKFTEQNKKNKLFSSNFSITDSSGTFSGNSNLTGSKQINTYSEFPPITYNPPTNVVSNSKHIDIEFIPINTGIIRKKSFKTSAELLVYRDGKLQSKDIYTTESTGATIRKDTNISLSPEDITAIIITPVDPSQTIDYSSNRLGGISDILKPYTTVPTKPSSTPVVPPSVISQPSYNAGGSGSDMNALNFSNLLPFNAIKKSLVGGSNPESISRQTQGTKPDNQTDPNKVKHPNTQIPNKNPAPMNGATQGNKAKGMISIPAVGAHVSVYFENGDLLFPVVDGVFYNQEDIKGVHDVRE